MKLTKIKQNAASQRLHTSLHEKILAASPGDKLLTEPRLAKELGVSRATLREAMRIFETQGLIYRRQGSGTYVARPTRVIESGLEVLESIDKLADRIGLAVTLGEHTVEQRPALAEEALALGLEASAEILYISRVILAEGNPAAYLVDVLPLAVLTPDDLAAGFTGSVLDLLLRRGQPELEYSRTEINAVSVTSDLARAMHIQRGDVLLRFTAYLYTSENRVVDYSTSYFLPGYFKFHVVRRVG